MAERMAERIVELETCTVIYPDGFDANQWHYDSWLEQQAFEASRAGQEVHVPQRKRHKINKPPEDQTKIT